MRPGVSAGSKKVGASVKCTAHVIWPAGASLRPPCASAREAGTSEARESASAKRSERTHLERFMTRASLESVSLVPGTTWRARVPALSSRTAGQARRRPPRGQANQWRSTAMHQQMEMTYCLEEVEEVEEVEEEMRTMRARGGRP